MQTYGNTGYGSNINLDARSLDRLPGDFLADQTGYVFSTSPYTPYGYESAGYQGTGSRGSGRGARTASFYLFKKKAPATPTIEYRTDPEQAKTIADLQSRLDALTQSTKARELELANAPEPVPGITQEQVNQQLADLRSTLGTQYTNERTKALDELRSQLSSGYESQLTTQRDLFQSQIGGLQEQIKTAQEADIQRQQRARVADAYANPNRQRVLGVKAARSPGFTSTGARRTVSSQFGRSGMRISSLNI
jgi:hypothetical protein